MDITMYDDDVSMFLFRVIGNMFKKFVYTDNPNIINRLIPI